MQSVFLNGIHVHFDTGGPADAPVLVFSNSLGTDYRVWDRVLERMGDKVRWVRYDKRGHGLSGATPAPYTVDGLADDLAALLDHLALKAVTVCGLSVGGMIAQSLASSRPDLVARLVLSDTGHRIGHDAMWNERIAAAIENGVESLADMTMKRWFSDGYLADRSEDVALWRAMLTRTPLEGYVGTSAAVRDCDLTERTKALRVPTLCIGGDEDAATTPELMRELTALIPGAVHHVVPGAGHLPGVENPDAVVALLSDFMGL